MTNEIPDMTVGGQVIPTHEERANVEGGGCVLCKMVVDEALKALNGSVNPVSILKFLIKNKGLNKKLKKI